MTIRGCQYQLDEYCDFGENHSFIISPSFVQSVYETGPSQHLQSPPESTEVPALENSQSDSHILQRAMSERVFSSSMKSISDEFELRRRKSSDAFDDDEFLIHNSPPPNLREYRLREMSDHEEVIEPKERQFSWSTLIEELASVFGMSFIPRKSVSSIKDYMKRIQK